MWRFKYIFSKIYLFLKKFLKKENLEIFLIKKILKKKNLVIDIGGNIGQKSDLILNIFPKSKIYIFEPFPNYYKFLIKKYKKNNNIHISNLGIGDNDEKKNLFYTGEKKNSEAFSFKKMNYLNKKIKCRIKPLDKIIPKLSPDLIKIDVEQYELKALNGAFNIIKRSRPYILLETTQKYLKKIEIFFKNIDYKIFAYEYYIFKDNKHVFIDPIKSWRKINLIKSNIYEKKLFNTKSFYNVKSYLLNIFALPKENISTIIDKNKLTINKINF